MAEQFYGQRKCLIARDHQHITRFLFWLLHIYIYKCTSTIELAVNASTTYLGSQSQIRWIIAMPRGGERRRKRVEKTTPCLFWDANLMAHEFWWTKGEITANFTPSCLGLGQYFTKHADVSTFSQVTETRESRTKSEASGLESRKRGAGFMWLALNILTSIGVK